MKKHEKVLFFDHFHEKAQYSDIRAKEMQLSCFVTNTFTLRHERTLSEARKTNYR
ncbi:MAG: hypothetical protein J6R36_05990 [Bacteroidaceae bacterium]|nr:hypothetical protein [Bacteroidaceae bacterium]